MNRRILATVAACCALMTLSACDSGSSKATPKPTQPSTPPTTAAKPPDCGNPVASIAPNGPLPPPLVMPDGSQMAKIVQRGRLIAGVSADTLLFGFRNPQSGQLEGFDIDMVKRVARAIFPDADTNPNRIEYRVMTYAQRIPALRDKKDPVDIVADVMTINCTRWGQIDFSSQYYDAGQKVLVRTDSPALNIGSLNGKKMCVAKGSTNYDELKAHYPKVVAVPVDDISDCLVLFQQSAVDSVTGDDTVLAGFVKQDPYAKIIPPAPQKGITSEPYGLGISKDHPEFVQFVNSVLEQMRADGSWKQMYSRWLGTNNPPNPPPAVYGRNP